MRSAQEALEEKLFEDMDIDKRCNLFFEKFSKGNVYPAMEFFDWHNKLTGSCEMGRRAFAKDKGIDLDKDELTIEQFINLTRNAYGGSAIRQLEEMYSKGG